MSIFSNLQTHLVRLGFSVTLGLIGCASLVAALSAADTRATATIGGALPVPIEVLDINSTGGASSEPREMVVISGVLYFSAEDPFHGRELWKSDGTPQGTMLVKDLIVGPKGGNPYSLIDVNGTLFFGASQEAKGLWKSDGSMTGTVSVKEGVSILTSSDDRYARRNMVNVNGLLFFVGFDDVHGYELWKSDGTADGTVMVKDIISGTTWSAPAWLTSLNGELFFVTFTATAQMNLWHSDGTLTGTVLMSSFPIASNQYGIYNSWMTNVNDTLYFAFNTNICSGGTSCWELWTSDGTPSGTVRLEQSLGVDPLLFNAIEANHVAYFVVSVGSPTHYYQLWKSDGTLTGTHIVSDYLKLASRLTAVDDGLYFINLAEDVYRYELWHSDGTLTGTAPVPMHGPLSLTQSLRNWTAFNHQVYFLADDGVHGYEFWRSDGTADGTVLVKDINPGAAPVWTGGYSDYDGRSLAEVKGRLLLAADDGQHGLELWTSDGSPDNTVLVKDLSSGTEGSALQQLTASNDHIFFTANDNWHGQELWISNGTPTGTLLVSDIYSGAAGSDPTKLTDADGTVFFWADDGTNGHRLWRSDGTPTGTRLVTNVNFESVVSALPDLFPLHDRVYFAVVAALTQGLWVSDGTPSGTLQLHSYVGNMAVPWQPTVMKDQLFFAESDDLAGYALWKSDGTPTGTVMVKDPCPDSNWCNIGGLAEINGQLYFKADFQGPYQLWRSDGTPGGTQMLKDLFPGKFDLAEWLLGHIGPVIYFTGHDAINGGGLWRSDGTSAGTWLVRKFESDLCCSTGADTVGNILYFIGYDNIHGNELWQTDGTSAGTHLVKDITVGITDTAFANFMNVNGKLIFTANGQLWKSDAESTTPLLTSAVYPELYLSARYGFLYFLAADDVHGTELWRTDGTPAGTELVADVYPGAGNGAESVKPATVNGTLFFVGNNGSDGPELWAIPNTLTERFCLPLVMR